MKDPVDQDTNTYHKITVKGDHDYLEAYNALFDVYSRDEALLQESFSEMSGDEVLMAWKYANSDEAALGKLMAAVMRDYINDFVHDEVMRGKG